MANKGYGDGFDDWHPNADLDHIPMRGQFTPAAAPDTNVPAPTQTRSVGRMVIVAVIALVGGLILLDWWAFFFSVSTGSPNGLNAVPFLAKAVFSIAYLAVAWRVFTR